MTDGQASFRMTDETASFSAWGSADPPNLLNLGVILDDIHSSFFPLQFLLSFSRLR